MAYQNDGGAPSRLTEEALKALANYVFKNAGTNKEIMSIAATVNSAINQRETNRKRSRRQMEEEESVSYMLRYRVLPRNLDPKVAATYNLRNKKTKVQVEQRVSPEDIQRDKAMHDGEDLKPEPGDLDDDDTDGDSNYVPTDDDGDDADDAEEAVDDAEETQSDDDDNDDDGMSVSSFDSDLPLAELARLAEKQRHATKAAIGIEVNIVPDGNDDDGNDCSTDDESYDGSFADSDEEDLPVIQRALAYERKNDETVENMHDVLDKTAYRNWPGFWEVAFPTLEAGTRVGIKYDAADGEQDVHVVGEISMTTPTDYDLEMAGAKRAKKKVTKQLKKMLVLDDKTYTSPLEWAHEFHIDVDTVQVFVRRIGTMKWENIVDMVMNSVEDTSDDEDTEDDDDV